MQISDKVNIQLYIEESPTDYHHDFPFGYTDIKMTDRVEGLHNVP